MKTIIKIIRFLLIVFLILASFLYILLYTPVGLHLSFFAIKSTFPKEKNWTIDKIEGHSLFDFSLRNIDIKVDQTTTHIDRIHFKWLPMWQSDDNRWVIEAIEIFNFKSYFHGKLNRDGQQEFIDQNTSKTQEFILFDKESIKNVNEYIRIDMIDLNQFEIEDDDHYKVVIRTRFQRNRTTMKIDPCYFQFNGKAFKCEGEIDENGTLKWKINPQ